MAECTPCCVHRATGILLLLFFFSATGFAQEPATVAPGDQPAARAPAADPNAAPPAAAEDDGPTYPVTKFVVEYAMPHAGQPPIEDVADEIGQLVIPLGQSADGFVAPRGEYPAVDVKLG